MEEGCHAAAPSKKQNPDLVWDRDAAERGSRAKLSEDQDQSANDVGRLRGRRVRKEEGLPKNRTTAWNNKSGLENQIYKQRRTWKVASIERLIRDEDNCR